jgi:ribosomal protein L40E
MAGTSWKKWSNRPKGGKFLSKWKENKSVVVYLHTKSGLHGRYTHFIVYVTKDDKGKLKLAYLNYVCAEDYETQANNRDHEPVKCPICLFRQWLRENENIADNETVWDASVGGKYDKIITKADAIGEGDWRNSFIPKHQSVFAVVNVEDLESGLHIMAESISLADSIGKVISDTIESEGEEEGDPDINPYPIKLKYNANASKPEDYYTALRFMKYKPKGEDKAKIEDLLESDNLNLDGYTKSLNTKEVIEIMKATITVDFDFSLLGVSSDDDDEDDTKKTRKSSKKTSKKSKKTEEDDEVVPEDNPDDDEIADDEEDFDDEEDTTKTKTVDCEVCKGKGYKIVKSKKNPGKKVKKKCKECDGTGKVEVEEEDEEDEEMSECPECGAKIPDSAEECPKCGAEFADDDDDEEDDDDDDEDD